MLGTEQMKIEVISDTICPWCYVGKRRMERAIALLGNPPIEVEWKPFQLNPTMPEAALAGAFREAIAARSGSACGLEGDCT